MRAIQKSRVTASGAVECSRISWCANLSRGRLTSSSCIFFSSQYVDWHSQLCGTMITQGTRPDLICSYFLIAGMLTSSPCLDTAHSIKWYFAMSGLRTQPTKGSTSLTFHVREFVKCLYCLTRNAYFTRFVILICVHLVALVIAMLPHIATTEPFRLSVRFWIDSIPATEVAESEEKSSEMPCHLNGSVAYNQLLKWDTQSK